MARKRIVPLFVGLAFLLVLSIPSPTAIAQAPAPSGNRAPRTDIGTSFTYQGHLNRSGSPATGTYDFRFILYDAASGGSQVGSTPIKEDVSVAAGAFAVVLDFGNVFTGASLYLEVGVRDGSSTGAYATLSPRSGLLPTPYALYATSAPWSGLTGVPAGFGDGVDNDTTYSAGTGLTLTSSQFSLTTSYRLPQSCSSNQLAKWNGSAWICADDNDTNSFWSLSGNSGTASNTNFVGTTDAVALVLRVNNVVGWRLAPNGTNTPNVIGGYSGNSVAGGVKGATIGGGGNSSGSSLANSVTGSGGTVCGGDGNSAAQYATVGGGVSNSATGYGAVVAGGNYNQTNTADPNQTIGGGRENSTNGYYNTIAGGYANSTSGANTTIGGGQNNQATDSNATVAGGLGNIASARYSTVPGGNYAAASHYGEMAFAGGRFAATGDAQTSNYVLRNTTTNSATPTELFLDGSDASRRITIAANRTLTFDILIVARSSDNAAAGYQIRGVIENSAGSTALVSGVNRTELGEEVASWDATVEADDTYDALIVKVTGDAGRTIRWVASVRTAEVSW